MVEKTFKEILLDSLHVVYDDAVAYCSDVKSKSGGTIDPPPPPPPPNTKSAEEMTFDVLGKGYTEFGKWVEENLLG